MRKRRTDDGAADSMARLDELVSRVTPAEGLGEVGRARVWRRLSRGTRAPSTRRRTPAWALAFAFAFGTLIAGSGAVVAARLGGPRLRAWFGLTVEPAPFTADVRPRVAVRPRRSSAPQADVIPAAAPAIAPTPPAPVDQPTPVLPASRPRLAPPPAASGPAPALDPRSTGLAEESALLTRALERLRGNRDVAGALALLDEHAHRFPTGLLAREAISARTDALLLGGRHAEALVTLERAPLGGVGRDLELRLVRGELRARVDCTAAIADFSSIIERVGEGPWLERALHGRAACRARTGDAAGAAADGATYLRRYPAGRFAAQARAAVAHAR